MARSVRIVHDAVPILAAGSPEGWGVALISGTGSLAFGRDRQGRSCRAGGWGFLFGDEGSGYAIALAGLRAAAQAADGRAPATRLLEGFLERFQRSGFRVQGSGFREEGARDQGPGAREDGSLSALTVPEPRTLNPEPPSLAPSPQPLAPHLPSWEALIPALYRIAGDRAAIAALAEVVFRAADQNDAQAIRIVDDAARELARLVGAVARKLEFAAAAFPLAFSGGVLVASKRLQIALASHLAELGLRRSPWSKWPRRWRGP